MTGKAGQAGHQNAPQVQNHEIDQAFGPKQCGESLLHHHSETPENKHVDEEVEEIPVDQSMCEDPVIFLAVEHLVGIELPFHEELLAIESSKGCESSDDDDDNGEVQHEANIVFRCQGESYF